MNCCNKLDDTVLKEFNEIVRLDRMIAKNNPYNE